MKKILGIILFVVLSTLSLAQSMKDWPIATSLNNNQYFFVYDSTQRIDLRARRMSWAVVNNQWHDSLISFAARNFLFTSDSSLFNSKALTLAQLAYKLNSSDTASLSNRIDLKFNMGDTSAFNSKSLTTAQLAYKLNASDTTSLSNRIDNKLSKADSNGVNGWYRRGYIDALNALDFKYADSVNYYKKLYVDALLAYKTNYGDTTSNLISSVSKTGFLRYSDFNNFANTFAKLNAANLTSGNMPYWNGTTLSNSNVYFNGSNVGIGTMAPDSLLTNNGSFHNVGNVKFDAKVFMMNVRADSTQCVTGQFYVLPDGTLKRKF